MAFPNSPGDLDIVVENNITYQWNATDNAWIRIATSNVGFNSVTSNTFVANTSVTIAGRNILAYTQAAFDVANTSIDSYARDTANTASANTIYTQGVNTTQNTNITYATNLAQAAFNQANTGGASADTYARDTANSASSNTIYTQGVDTSQNTRITTVETKAQAAFDAANTAIAVNIDQYARDTANTKLSLSGGTIAGNVTVNSVIANNSIYAPKIYSTGGTTNLSLSDIGIVSITSNGEEFKFGAAGIESSKGIYGGSYAGNKLSLNNETNLISNRYATVKIQTGTDGTVSNTWNFSGASLIFPDGTTQNTAFSGEVASSDTYARDKANTADTKAQAAFDKANTGSSGGGTSISVYGEIVVDSFIGNGSNTVFTLSTTPSNINHISVVVGGITQPQSTYSLTNANVTLSSAPATSQNVEITTINTTSTTTYITNNIISPFLLMGA